MLTSPQCSVRSRVILIEGKLEDKRSLACQDWSRRILIADLHEKIRSLRPHQSAPYEIVS